MFKQVKHNILFLLSILCFSVAMPVLASEHSCGGNGACVVSFVEIPVIAPMTCGQVQDVTYTIKNNALVSAVVTDSIEILPGDDGGSTVTIIGGSCDPDVDLSFTLAAGASCTIEVEISTVACSLVSTSKHDKKTSLGEIRQALVLFPSTSQGPAQPVSTIITLDLGSSSLMAYIANRTADSGISICPVFDEDGTFGGCSQYTDATFNVPVDIVLNNSSSVAYVANSGGSNTISVCKVDAAGNLSACTSFADDSFHLDVTGLRLNADNTVLYATNYANNTVSACLLDDDGGLSTCTSVSNEFFSGPNGRLVFDSSDLAYVANYDSNSVSICNTAFVTCSSYEDAVITGPLGIDIDSSGNYIYVSNSGPISTVAICEIQDGTLDTCTSSTGNDGDDNPTFNFTDQVINLFMHASNGYGYIPNDVNDTVSICPIGSDGSIGTCVAVTGTYTTPASVWIAEPSGF